MQTDIIIQARIGSSRLPGKTMLSLSGKEELWHVVERCKQVKNIDNIIVATTNDSKDDIIERFCIKHKILYYRGDESNVLRRYYEVASKYGTDRIVRITSDCPLIDPEIISGCILLHDSNNHVEYVSNCFNRVFPRGLDCEVFTFSSLGEAYKNASESIDLEHVTPFIRRNFKTKEFVVDKKFHGDFRITLDQIEDYQLLSFIYDKFYVKDEIIDVKDVIAYLAINPTITNINRNVEQKKI